MIGRLSGRVIEVDETVLLIDVNGVAYETAATPALVATAVEGSMCTCYTHSIISNDVQTLFAFASKPEREIFRTLIKVGGVGPKNAYSILGGLSVEDFVRCIVDQNIQRLAKVKGIGPKTAQRIVLELKDRLDSLPAPSQVTSDSSSGVLDEARSALAALGYRSSDVAMAIRNVPEGSLDLQEVIRLTLRQLSMG